MTIIIQWNLWIEGTHGSLKDCPLLRGVRYWEVILKRLSHLALNVLSASHGMSAIWDVHYWDVSFYFFELIYTLSNILFIADFYNNLNISKNTIWVRNWMLI